MSSPTMIAPPLVPGAEDSAELWQLTDAELADALAEEEAAARRRDYRRLRLLAEFHARDVAGRLAGLSTQAFLRHRMRLSPAEAARRVHAAEEFVESVTPSGERVAAQLPCTAAQLASGAISTEHAQVVSAAIRRLPTGLDPRIRDQAEEFLAAQAGQLDPAQLRVAARQLHTILDPDGTIEDDAPARRELSFRRDIDGTDVISGRLDPEGSATFQAALARLRKTAARRRRRSRPP